MLKALEDLGYYSVDNLPVELIPKFAELICDNPSIQSAALVVDVREGAGLKTFPKVYARIQQSVNRTVISAQRHRSCRPVSACQWQPAS